LLSAVAYDALEDSDNSVIASPVVAWELATKGRLGKWPGAGEAMAQLSEWTKSGRLDALPISIAHAALAGAFAVKHRDPFDRMLAAQSRIEGIPIVSADHALRQFDIDVLW